MPTPDGRRAGPHFGLVITPMDDVLAGKDLRLMGISTTYKTPPADGQWIIPDYSPGKPGGHVMTGLSQASAAKASWIVRVPQAEVVFNGKHISAKLAREIDGWLKAKLVDSLAFLKAMGHVP